MSTWHKFAQQNTQFIKKKNKREIQVTFYVQKFFFTMKIFLTKDFSSIFILLSNKFIKIINNDKKKITLSI